MRPVNLTTTWVQTKVSVNSSFLGRTGLTERAPLLYFKLIHLFSNTCTITKTPRALLCVPIFSALCVCTHSGNTVFLGRYGYYRRTFNREFVPIIKMTF